MKIVRENINEKFAEKSDPIKDMGIGAFKKRIYSDDQVAAKYIYSILPAIIGEDEIPDNIIYPIGYRNEKGNIQVFNEEYFKNIADYLHYYVDMSNDNRVVHTYIKRDIFLSSVLKKLHEILLMAGYPKTEE